MSWPNSTGQPSFKRWKRRGRLRRGRLISRTRSLGAHWRTLTTTYAAVRVPGIPLIYFLTEPPPDPKGLDVEEGAWIEHLAEYQHLARGQIRRLLRPGSTSSAGRGKTRPIARSSSITTRSIRPSGRRPGAQFGGHSSGASWSRFAGEDAAALALRMPSRTRRAPDPCHGSFPQPTPALVAWLVEPRAS